ncbi:MAG: type III-B CRISPR-associated protein Cas10/Cmr2, partial [Syntrophaceae bacterium]
ADVAGVDIREEVLALEDGVIDDLAQERATEGNAPRVWNSPAEIKVLFIKVWRKLRDLLTQKGSEGDRDPNFRHLWQTMPADGRCPDHSIWDHSRVTSALAFMTRAKKDATSRDPWLFRYEIGPVGRFIEEADTSRDLWMGSFLLSDIIWHAMGPLIQRYGPDCIIYPDLRANPRADVWLKEEYPDALPGSMENPATYAAVLPNTFTAVVPFGGRTGDSHLRALEELAGEAATAVRDRWFKLANIVEKWIAGIQGSGPDEEWRAIWKRQHEKVLSSTWSAVKWSEMEKIRHCESLTMTDPLPCQHERPVTVSQKELEEDRRKIVEREGRLKPFVPGDVWVHYSRARSVFARTNLPVHQMERGFDYALTHHQLRTRHALRGQQSSEAGIFGESGEKCTLCGRRQALYNLDGRPDKLHGHRQAARAFWESGNDNQKKRLNPDPFQQDRLCGVCAMKRFLVEAGVDGESGELTGINPVWAGYGVPVEELGFEDDKPRVPFPSTATVAAQGFLEKICTRPDLAAERDAVVRNYRQAGLPRTGFARSLSRLAALEKDRSASPFLMLDTQQSLFPETLGISIRRAEKPGERAKADALEELRDSVIELRRKARKAKIEEPGTRIAVIRLDGDNMGRLLLGDPEIIQTTWRDVIHPEATSSNKKSSLLTAGITRQAGWPDLLESKRLMGPSLHAFISRSLAEFSHRIVPWVVEREFSGRLIYCGGDDILAMSPAGDALLLAARLQQLFSAPFILDTMPGRLPWGWRKPGGDHHHDETEARRRFLIPVRSRDTDGDIVLPLGAPEDFEPHPQGDGFDLSAANEAEILTMPGKGYSLSAGIAYGHFKSPLSGLLRQSAEMLKKWAKGAAGRNAVGLSHFSRNGVKTEFAMPWRSENGSEPNAQLFQRVVDGFCKGTLPGRLPYKLRNHCRLLHELRDGEEKDRLTLIEGLFQEEAGDSGKLSGVRADALFLWKQGLRLGEAMPGGTLDRAADGLLIARMLAGDGEEA